MPDRFPGYDVLAKWNTPSWNEKTREVIAARLALPAHPRFFTADEFAIVVALADRILPQPTHRPRVPVELLLDDQLHRGQGDGYRAPGMPPHPGEAWRHGLRALDAEAIAAHGSSFANLPTETQDSLLRAMERGEMRDPAWGDLLAKEFFDMRLARDLVRAYYAHPASWSEIGWGGPASPRGYVRMGFDERDPWEAAEDRGDPAAARRRNARVG